MNTSFEQAPMTLAALAVVIGLIWLATRLARFAGLDRRPVAVRAPRDLVLRDTIQLDRQRRFHVIRCGKHDLVVLTGGSSDVVVHLPGLCSAEQPG